MNKDTIEISGEPTADPQVCRFVVNRDLYPDGSFTCRNQQMAQGSPLLEAIFAIGGVVQVMVSGSTVTVAKNSHDDWPTLGAQIGGVIREHVAGGGVLIDPNAAARSSSEAALREQVERLFAESINPQIKSHGGWVELAEVKGTTVYLRLGGGCQGCASAGATLRLGIEKAIRRAVPQVSAVVDVTDHAAGTKPFYT